MKMNAVDVTPLERAAWDVADHYGVRTEDVVPVPVQGQVNFTAYLGRDLVVRIPRSPKAAEQLAKEARVIELVRDAGVPTPELVAHDDALRVASLPYMVQQRVHGATLADGGLDPVALRRTYASLGQVLKGLHGIRRNRVGPVESVPEPYAFSVAELVSDLAEAGEIGRSQRERLLESFASLQPEGPSSADPVLLHRDVIPSNIMVDGDGTVTALLDWGCAEWGNPARDLVGLRIRTLPDVVAGYRSAIGAVPSGAVEGPLERDALWYHRYLALARLLKRPSTSEDRNWAAPRSASLVDFLEFTSAADEEPWASLLRPRSSQDVS